MFKFVPSFQQNKPNTLKTRDVEKSPSLNNSALLSTKGHIIYSIAGCYLALDHDV